MIVKSQPPMWRQPPRLSKRKPAPERSRRAEGERPLPGWRRAPLPVSPRAYPPEVTSVISTAYHFRRTLKGIPLTCRFSKRFPTLESQETQPQLLYRRTIRPCYSFSRT
jgi:hypothetical protein